eukprot:4356799-Prymnesium_polylepis.1
MQGDSTHGTRDITSLGVPHADHMVSTRHHASGTPPRTPPTTAVPPPPPYASACPRAGSSEARVPRLRR